MQTVAAALLRISAKLGGALQQSGFYATPAFPAGAGPAFVNAAAVVETDMTPAAILTVLHRIEAEAARTRDLRWGQRTLDLDLIGFGDQVLPDAATFHHWRNLPLAAQQEIAPSQLILPHPRMQDRAFVLVPLADVAPHWRHPVLGRTVTQMRDACPADDLASVTPLQTGVNSLVNPASIP